MGDRYWEATTLTRLGDTHHAAGRNDRARECWIAAFATLDELDHADAKDVHAKIEQLAAVIADDGARTVP
jgi:hypothetical protein